MNPETYVVGSRPVFEGGQHKIDIIEPLRTLDGKPVGQSALKMGYVWQRGKELGVLSHWRNEAARRRAGGDMTRAAPQDLVQVPLYRGMPSALARDFRASARRRARAEALAKEAAKMAELKALIAAQISTHPAGE